MRRASLASATLLLATATAAFAATDGHGHGGIPWLTLLFSTINLGIFVWILARYAFPAIRSWVSERRDLIVGELEAAAAVHGEALRLRSEWEGRLAKLDDEIAEMRAQARRDIERERERILAAAEATAASIRRDAERVAQAEAKQLEAQLRADVARKAVEQAEARIRSEWNNDDQQRLVADFLRHLQA